MQKVMSIEHAQRPLVNVMRSFYQKPWLTMLMQACTSSRLEQGEWNELENESAGWCAAELEIDTTCYEACCGHNCCCHHLCTVL